MDSQTVTHPGNGHSAPVTERTNGETADDISVNAAVRSVLMWSQLMHGLNAEVETLRGVVIMRGTADSATTKNLASLLATNTQGVCAVDNRLEICSVNRKFF